MDVEEEMRRREENNRVIVFRRNIRLTVDPFNMISDEHFRINFRLSKALARLLIRQLEPYMYAGDNPRAVPPSIRVLATLSFYGSGSYQAPIGCSWLTCLGRSTVGRFIDEVTTALNSPEVQRKWIRFPMNRQEKEVLMRKHETAFSIPRVVGFIDGTEISIVTPSEQFHPQTFWTRKKQYAINCQVICDSDLVILNVVANHPGCCNDPFIFRGCAARRRMIEAYHAQQCWLLGDGGYALEPWLLVPIENALPGSDEELFTNKHCQARCCVERCFGVLKAVFRCLIRQRGLHYSPVKCCQIIKACCVLHNMRMKARLHDLQDEVADGDEEEMPLQGDEEIDLAYLLAIADNKRVLNRLGHENRLLVAQHLRRVEIAHE